jgi:23S rRNA (cytosine1962-C5)-methyltransferase
VTTVDLAEPAIAFANVNWAQHNGLDPSLHEGIAADCFAFLESARRAKERWDLVVVDPPSFAPNKESLDRARASYIRVFAAAAQVGCARTALHGGGRGAGRLLGRAAGCGVG